MENQDGRQFLSQGILDMIDKADETEWIIVKELNKGDILRIKTMNTTYDIEIIDPEKGFVKFTNDSDRFPMKNTEGSIGGTTLSGTGSMIKLGHITTGMRLCIWAEGIGELTLSSTQEVFVNGEKRL